MVEQSAGTEWTFVVDTDHYAGNFERELCAYLTGRVGECGVGVELADLARTEIPPDMLELLCDLVADVPDEHGCARPVTIWPHPGWFNDGMGNEWPVTDNDLPKQLAAYVKSVEDIYGGYMKQPLQMLKDIQSGKTVQGWTEANCQQAVARHQKEIDKAKALKEIQRFPAYMSVGIWMNEKPSQEIIDFLKERAGKFVEAKRKNGRFSWDKDFTLKIEGFRLVQNIKTSKETAI